MSYDYTHVSAPTPKQVRAWRSAGRIVCQMGASGGNPGRRTVRECDDAISKRDATWLAGLCRDYGYDVAAIEAVLGESARNPERVTAENTHSAPRLLVDERMDEEEPLDELISRRCNHFKRLEKVQREEIVVRVSEPGPVGILFFGDPHLDDDGTNLPLIRDHLRLIRETPGLFGGCIGDTHNGWVGRLARLYGEQGTTQREAWRLVEWFFQSADWAVLVGGNHDAHWHGSNNPIDWVIRQAGASAVYNPNDTRIRLEGPGWERPLRIWARHDFPGRSQWNPTHGIVKAARMRDDYRADIYVAGHTHDPAFHWEPRSTEGDDWYAVRLGAYKTFDDFAEEKGFPTKAGGEAMVLVTDGKRKWCFPDVEAGVMFLRALRGRS